ncbi:MAG: hypothetical protein QOF17_702 [Solirubrobacteraceae bacterium]|jgi:hypothetical protein|nr:hypothetical protein [Solirubrobacteraceae bacterium]
MTPHAPFGRSRLQLAQLVLAGLIAVAALTAVGWVIGGAVQPAPPPPPPPAPPREVAIGAFRVTVPHGWSDRPSRSGTTADALGASTFAPDESTAAWLAVAPVDDATLVPRRLRDRFARPLGAPQPVRLAGRPAWAYSPLTLKGGGRLALVVAPTVRDVLLVGCEAPKGSAPRPCAGGVSAISGPEAVAPTADLLLRRTAAPALSRLARWRSLGAKRLRRARSARGQAAAAAAVAQAHRVTAQAIAPSTSAGSRLVAALRGSAAAYDQLASVARRPVRGRGPARRQRADYAAARQRARRADAAVTRALSDLRR